MRQLHIAGIKPQSYRGEKTLALTTVSGGWGILRNCGIDGMASGKKFNQQNAKIL
jgi:hypothetical protein